MEVNLICQSDTDMDEDFSFIQPLDLITKDVYEPRQMINEKNAQSKYRPMLNTKKMGSMEEFQEPGIPRIEDLPSAAARGCYSRLIKPGVKQSKEFVILPFGWAILST